MVNNIYTRCLLSIVTVLCVPLVLAQTQPIQEYLTTTNPTVLFSVNDGESGALIGSPTPVADSVTVIHLSPDAPPRVATSYGSASNTILGSPHAAIVGRFGIVTNHDARLNENMQFLESDDDWVGENEIVSIDLDSLQVADKLALDSSPSLAVTHPDGRRLIVGLADGWAVLEVLEDGSFNTLSRSQVAEGPGSFDVGPDGRTIIAAVRSEPRSIVRFALNPDNSITHVAKIASGDFVVDGPFSPRISPDGETAMVLNSGGFSDGVLDDVLIMDLASNRISHRIAQVADGLESLAFHPTGRFAVVSCLNLMPWTETSHLAVIALDGEEPRLLYHLPIERIPEGIEFTPDGRQLFVGSTFAGHISAYDVDGVNLKRSPFVLLTGIGHAALGITAE